MSLPDKALWIIERNSTEPLTLDGIAATCGVSRSHLAHAFGTATGVSVMQYVRGRRLSAAARALAAGAPDILAIALEAGYGSHEAFTRAFRDRFQQTPVRQPRHADWPADCRQTP
jgi:AraC family transcriptional regulator